MFLAMQRELRNIVRGVIKADRKSQRRFYEYFYAFSFNTCIPFCKSDDEALEIVNDGFLKVFRQLPGFNTAGEHFEVCLKDRIKRIMIEAVIDRYRVTDKNYFLTEAREMVFELPVIDQSSVDKLFYSEIINLVQQLPCGCRIVFGLYAIHGFTHEAIAEKLNIAIGTSQTSLAKARENINRILQHPWPASVKCGSHLIDN
jgi:RNA polymerase sigma-70 factor (ECF subfamily)